MGFWGNVKRRHAAGAYAAAGPTWSMIITGAMVACRMQTGGSCYASALCGAPIEAQGRTC